MAIANTIGRGVEWAVGLISPRRAAIRSHFRRMAESGEYRETILTMMRARGYRAAKPGSNTTPWLGGTRSADAEILNDLPKLRDRSRELNRDDPIGSGLTNTFVCNVVGTGLRVQQRTDVPSRNKRIEAVWKSRRDELAPAEQLTDGGLQALWLRKVLEDGEVLIKQSIRKPGDPIFFETIEADRLATPLGFTQKPRDKGGEIRDGVEKDRYGIPVAYWIRKRHPGDVFQVPRGDENEYQRVPVEICKHLKFTKRPGQSRGVPIFHAILQDLRDLDLLLLAGLKRVQIAACLSLFIQSEMGVEEVLDVTAEKFGYKMEQMLEPGMIWKLYPGESVQSLIPNFPSPELDPFIIMIARRIGAALGVSWQVVLKDFSDSTYSSARTDLTETRPTYTCLRVWLVDNGLRWARRAVLEDVRLRGDSRMRGVSDENIDQAQWIGNGWRWIDPLKEAKAIEIALKIGLTTLQAEAAKLGLDWEELIEQRKREKEALEAAGLAEPAEASAVGRDNEANRELIRDIVEEAIEDTADTEVHSVPGNGRLKAESVLV